MVPYERQWACDIFAVGEVLDDGAMTFDELNEWFVPGLGFPLQEVLDKWMAKGLILFEDGKYRWNYEGGAR